MNWHSGNIAEAVAESKAKDAIFVVYIEGQDEMSAKLGRFLNDARVSAKMMTNDFVAVKVQGESATYTQFSSLYKVVPVPSIFFIGKSGTPLDVTTGIIESVDELLVKIDKVLLLAGKQTAAAAASTSGGSSGGGNPVAVERSIAGAEDGLATLQVTASQSEESSSSEAAAPDAIETPEFREISSDSEAIDAPEGTDMSKTNEASSEAAAASSPSPTVATPSLLPTATAVVPSLLPQSVPLVPTAPPVDNTQRSNIVTDADITQLLERKRLERQEEQKRLEKENELRRRREGREAQIQQAQAREQELKNMQERIRRERLQEQEARERILAQIAADRAEQANRSEVKSNNTITTSTTTTTSATFSAADSDQLNPITSSPDETRLQIRLPGGITRTKAFPIAEPLTTVRVYVLNELLAGSNIRDFTLATSYPRREFKTEDELKTLIDLNLVPNAVLLVLKREQVNSVVRTSNNLFNILSSVLWAILTPATMAIDYINKMGFQRIRQRFMQMVSNVGLVKSGPGTGTGPGRTLNNTEGGASAQDASARRNMGMFEGVLHSRQTPNLPDSTSDDATSTHSGDPQYQPPPMIFSEGAISQQAANQRSGGVYRRYGESNIRRLADTAKDEDDKATYNGNSTQQQ